MRRLALAAAALLAACGSDTQGLPGSGIGLVTVAAQVPIPPNYGIHDTFVRDGLAFVCAWNSGLLIYDVGNGIIGGAPDDPRLVGSVVTSDNGVPGGAAVHNAWWYHAPSGEQRYVFVGQEGPGVIGRTSYGDIHVVDVSNMARPVEVAFLHLDSAGTHNFWVDEAAQVLYAAYYNGGVVAVDISGTLSGDLGSRVIDRVQPGGASYVWGVMLHQGSLYATDMLSGLWQLRLAGGVLSAVGGGNNVTARYSSDLWVRGGFAYTGTWGNRGQPGNLLHVWALDSTGAPVAVDSVTVPGVSTVSDVEVSPDGRLLMLGGENGGGEGLHFYRLTNPAHPTLALSYPVEHGVHTATFAIIGNRLYVFAAKNPAQPRLLILDVTDL